MFLRLSARPSHPSVIRSEINRPENVNKNEVNSNEFGINTKLF